MKSSHIVEVLVSDLTYLPNPQQRRVKEAFWVRWNENPLCDPADVPLSEALRVTGDGRLERWWSQPGFKEWFRNQEEFRERASVLAQTALDTIEEILSNRDAQPAARIAAAKLAMEIARKMPQKQAEPKYLDDSVGKMDKQQLEQFIQRNIHLIPAGGLQVPNESDKVDGAG